MRHQRHVAVLAGVGPSLGCDGRNRKVFSDPFVVEDRLEGAGVDFLQEDAAGVRGFP